MMKEQNSRKETLRNLNCQNYMRCYDYFFTLFTIRNEILDFLGSSQSIRMELANRVKLSNLYKTKIITSPRHHKVVHVSCKLNMSSQQSFTSSLTDCKLNTSLQQISIVCTVMFDEKEADLNGAVVYEIFNIRFLV